MEEISIKQFKNEQEGFERAIGIPENEVPRSSSVFYANATGLSDFRGNIPDQNGNPGATPSHKGRNFVEWETSPAEKEEASVFTWIGGSQTRPAMKPAYPYVTAKLFVDGILRLEFPIGFPEYYRISEKGFGLTFAPKNFLSLVESAHRYWSPWGVTGFYHLEVPVEFLKKGTRLRLKVELSPTDGSYETFFYVSPRKDALKVNLSVLRMEVERIQNDVFSLKKSHEMLYAQIYPQLFPKIKGNLVIAHQDDTKHLHPANVTVMRDGEIVITVREATDHLALDGRMIMVRSKDNGRTWSDKELIFDLGNCDHRASPVFELPDGDWVTTDYRAGAEYKDGIWGGGAPMGITLWPAWSIDRGKTWQFGDKPMTVPDMKSKYGEVERHMILLPSGRLLVASNYVQVETDVDEKNSYFQNVYRIAVFCSDDKGRSWNVLSTLPFRDGIIGEATMLRTKSGKILLLSRTQEGRGENWKDRGALMQCVSYDEGKTWGDWITTPMSSMSSPGHLLQLQDGRILCTHASRSYPGSIYVTTSDDEGTTWNAKKTKIITNDLQNVDSCYPNSGQMGDGTIITVWYSNLFGKFFVGTLIYGPEEL